MSPYAIARLRIAALLIVVVVIETALASDLRVFGVAPDLMVLVVICSGLTGGTEAGAWVGFWAGLLMDMFLTSTPVGLSALTYCLIGASVGALRSSMLTDRKAILPVVGFVATAAAVLLFVAVGDVLGQHQLLGAGRTWLIKVVAIESLWNTVLAIPAAYVYGRAARGSAGVERLGIPMGSPAK